MAEAPVQDVLPVTDDPDEELKSENQASNEPVEDDRYQETKTEKQASNGPVVHHDEDLSEIRACNETDDLTNETKASNEHADNTSEETIYENKASVGSVVDDTGEETMCENKASGGSVADDPGEETMSENKASRGPVADDTDEENMSENHTSVETVKDDTGEEAKSETQESEEDGGDYTENKPSKRIWTPDEVQSLFIKAINFRSPLKDIETVLRSGADVNRPFNNGLQALHYAAYIDNSECLELLLRYGANVNSTDEIGYTPLHLAARRGNYDTIVKLIENGAIINFTDPDAIIHNTGQTTKLGYATTEPLNLAIQNNHPNCAEYLLLNGARPNNKYFMGNEICLAPLDETGGLELLLKYGADPNVFNRCGLSPLMKACKDHHIHAVRVLLKYGADINAQCPPLFEQKSVLQFAIQSGNIVIINILLSRGVEVCRLQGYKYSALHSAVLKGRADICRVLLQYGCDVNERSEEGSTALMLACGTSEMKERKEIVQMLIDSGADVNAHAPCYCFFDPYLAPITEYFKHVGDTEAFSIVELLILHGAKIHFTSSDLDLKRNRDPFSILPYCKCMVEHYEVFDLVLRVAGKFSPLGIHATETIPEGFKDELLWVGTRPRELKHLTRLVVYARLGTDIPDKIPELPLPQILKTYLNYK